METTPTSTPAADIPSTAPPALQLTEELTDRELLLALVDELSGIRTALVSALQLICSVPPFKGTIGVTEDGELYQLNREQRRAAK